MNALESIFTNNLGNPLKSFVCYEEVTSTMDLARKYIESSAITPALILAKKQSNGRGRQQSSWQSEDGGFYGTYILKSKIGVSNLSGFSLVVGVVLYEIFKSLGIKTALKWPNDVLALNRKKLSGILIECESRGENTYVLIGIGCNLAEHRNLLPEATSLELLTRLRPFSFKPTINDLKGYDVVNHDVAGSRQRIGEVGLSKKRYTPTEFGALVATKLIGAWDLFSIEGFKAFREKWIDASLSIGSEVEVNMGERIIDGKYAGVSDLGELLIENNNGISRISAGHVVRWGKNVASN